MNIIRKIIYRLNAEYNWVRLGFYTYFVYYHREPLLIFDPQENRGLSENPLECSGGGDCDFCDLAVVTFNNAEVVKYQIRTLRKFFKYPFRYTVFDNSTNKQISDEILEICKKYSVKYIRLPKQEFLPKGYGSYSHGIACNYLFKKYIKNGCAKFFGLLDHDIFLTKDFDISQSLSKQFFYGIKHRFYLWPGIWFMSMDRLVKYGVDFRPSLHRHGDTGACNGAIHFNHIDWSQYEIVDDVHCFFDDSDYDIFRNGYSLMDGRWLHCWNASDYMGKGVDNKMNKIYSMLEESLSD